MAWRRPSLRGSQPLQPSLCDSRSACGTALGEAAQVGSTWALRRVTATWGPKHCLRFGGFTFEVALVVARGSAVR